MRIAIIVLLLFCSSHIDAVAQGCSDAGFCSAGSLSVNAHDDTNSAAQTWVSAAFSYGLGDFGVQVISPRIEVRHDFNRMWHASARIGMQMSVGDLATTTGLSDVVLTVASNVLPKLQLTLGVKLPLSDGNMMAQGGSPLPMDYQPSLGTVDLIAGAVWHAGDFSLTAALQQPLTQNKNTFTPLVYPTTSPAQQYHSTNGFERKSDVLLRASYVISVFEESLRLHGSLLPIYHIANDTYVDTAGVRRDIAGSRGVTLNVAILAEYILNPFNRIEVTIAAPLVVRDRRPDGLTRSILIGVEYRVAL